MSAKTAIAKKTGRPRGFDEDAALEAAMRVFWEKSYEGATMADLTEAIGINRSSMYAAFGDKEALFRLVMERYRRGPMSYFRAALEKKPIREVVESLLYGTATFLSQPRRPRGCFSVQAALACGEANQVIQQAMIAWRRSDEDALQKRLRAAQKAGELKKSINPSDFARYLSALMNGLRVQAANGAGKDELRRIVDLALENLRFERHSNS